MKRADIKVVFFDAYGVLIGVEDSRHALANYLDLPYEQVKEAGQRSLARPGIPSWTSVNSRAKEVAFSHAASEALLRELGLEVGTVQIEKVSSFYLARQHHALEGVMEALEYLASNYRLGLISNSAPSMRNSVLPETGLLKYLDPIVISGEVGVRKPDPEIYLIALKSAKVDAEEAAFIDDVEQFLDVARQIGFGLPILLDEVGDSSGEFQTITKLTELKKIL